MDVINEQNLKINLRGNGMNLTQSIYDYVVKRVTNLGKFLSKYPEEILVDFEVGKTVRDQRSGKIFRADCKISISGKDFYSSSEQEDLYVAIDDVKEKLFQEIEKSQNKNRDLWRRGARSIKKMFKGLSKRNPFTSKY